MVKYLGVHLSVEGSFLSSIKEAKNLGMSAFQIMTAPRTKALASLSEEALRESKEFAKKQKDFDIMCVSHAPLMMNLVSDNRRTKNFSYASLLSEVFRCRALGIHRIVVHPGSSEDKEIGIKNLASVYNSLVVDLKNRNCYGDVTICFETMAGAGNQILTTPEQVCQFIDLVEDKAYLGICLDTAHVFGGGYLPSKFISLLGDKSSYIKVVHFNDSSTRLGTHKDAHQNMGLGNIPSEEFDKVLSLEDAWFIDENPAVKKNGIFVEEEVQVLKKFMV